VRMRVLHLSCFLEYRHGGAELVVRQLIELLRREHAEDEHDAVCLAGGSEPSRASKTFRVHAPSFIYEGHSLCQAYKRYVLFFPSAAQDRSWVKAIRKAVPSLESYDLFHCHDQHWFAAASAVASALGKPLILTSHDNLPRSVFPGQTNQVLEHLINRSLQRHARRLVPHFALARAITAPSRFTARTITAFLERYDQRSDHVRVLYNWIEDYHFAALNIPVHLRPQSLLFVGRLSREKGLDLLLGAWETLPETTLTVAGGSGPLLPTIKEIAAENPRLDWHRQVPHDHIIPLVREHVVALCPSRFEEPFGKTALEYRLAGARIVASTAGGLPEVLEGYPSAVFVDHRLPEASFSAGLAEATRKALTQPVIEEPPEQRDRFLSRFRASTCVQKYRELYEVCVPSRR
jgi:glycosyltransferase involved in cell wall biosynthesis